MSKDEILNYFYTNGVNYGAKRTFAILLCGLVVGMVIFATYYLTTDKVAYSRKFNWSLVILLLVTQVIMLVISSNIVVSLGMVGALSIVRFRTAVKDSRDTVFVFWAITEGLAASSEHYMMTFTSVAFIAAVAFLSSRKKGGRDRYIMVIRGSETAVDMDALEEYLKKEKISSRISTINRDEKRQEYIVEISTRNSLSPKMTEELMKIEGIKSVNIVSGSGENMG